MAQLRMDVSMHGDGAVLPFVPKSGSEGALTPSAYKLLDVIVGLGLVWAQLLGERLPVLAAAPVQVLTSHFEMTHSGERRGTKRKLFVQIEVWVLSCGEFNKIIKHVSHSLTNITAKG